MISRKERTAAEVSEWLAGKGASPEEVDGVVDRLVALELLDDEKFARLYAEDKRNLAGWGSARIERTLIDRGIPSEIAREAVAAGGCDEVERAVSVLADRGGDLEDERDRQRALGLLARRGFSSEDAYEAIRRLRRDAAGLGEGDQGVASGATRSR